MAKSSLETLKSRLKYHGGPFTVAIVARLAAVDKAAAYRLIRRLRAPTRRDSVPFLTSGPVKGSYLLTSRPRDGWTKFRCWLTVHPGRGWIRAPHDWPAEQETLPQPADCFVCVLTTYKVHSLSGYRVVRVMKPARDQRPVEGLPVERW